MFNAKITGYVFPDSYYARSLVVYSVSLNRIGIRYYISCSVRIMVWIMARFTCISPHDTYWCRYEGIDAGYDTEQDM